MTDNNSPDGKPDLHKIYDAIWQNMERENNLINDRNQWAIVLSAGILATQAALVGVMRAQDSSFEGNLFYGGVFFLLFVLSALALYFCHRSSEGVMAAHNQLDYLKREYRKFGEDHENIFQTQLKLPRPFGNPHDHYRGNATAVTFPKVMFVFWLIFAVLEFVAAIVYMGDGLRGIDSALHHHTGSHGSEPKNIAVSMPDATSENPKPVAVAPEEKPPELNSEKQSKPKKSHGRRQSP